MLPKQLRFVEEYVLDGNATQAAIRAGYSKKTASSIGTENLGKPEISEAIKKRRQKMAEKAEFTAVDVLKRWVTIATADPNELIQHRIAPCRHCNGKGHRFQWKSPGEFEEALFHANLANIRNKDSRVRLPSKLGGFGYSRTAPVDPQCPECSGEGIGYTVAKDTRYLSPQALALYAGVKQTKDGLEIKMHDQGKALENIARHLGMYQDKVEITGKLTLETLIMGVIAREESEKAPAPPTIEGTAEDTTK